MDKKEPEFFDIKAVEIFEEGTWNGDLYSVDDLDKIVQAFADTKDNLKPYLKLGHNESQKILENDGLPAAGWISNVYRKGKKLFADFSNVPKKIYELIKRKAYRRVSSEIFIDIPVAGKEYPFALKAVALLGGDTPAVNSLDDILGLFTAPNFVELSDKTAKIRRYDFENLLLENKTEEINNMDQLEKALSEIETLKAEVKAFEELKKEIELKSAETKEFAEKVKSENELLKKEKKSIGISLKVEKYIQDGKITPAQAIILKEILSETDQTKKFKIGEKEFDGIDTLIYEFIESSTQALETEGASETGKEMNTDMDTKAKEFMAKNKVSYKEALLKVAAENK